MTTLVFCLDTSLSMVQQAGGGITLVDAGKSFIEAFVNHVTKVQPLRIDRVVLYTGEPLDMCRQEHCAISACKGSQTICLSVLASSKISCTVHRRRIHSRSWPAVL